MTHRRRSSNQRNRRGATAVLVALMIIFIVGMVAFGVDIGYIVLVRTQLQAAADSAAMAAVPAMINDPDSCHTEANAFAEKHWAGGQYVTLASGDVEIGTWDVDAETFTAATGGGSGNAVRVTARRLNVPLFFGPVLGKKSFSTEASAIAMSNPRDICFVVDLSGSMNDDTETAWVTDYLNTYWAGEGYSDVGTNLMQDVYTDFNFGTYPGTVEHWGQPLGVAQNNSAYVNMTSASGPMSTTAVAAAYRITSGDNEATRKRKCYSWIMDVHLRAIMPNAVPTPNSGDTASYNYWERYLDYVVRQGTRNSNTVPSLVNSSHNVSGLGNPQSAAYDDIADSTPDAFYNKLGYRTYVNFMMDLGRDVQAGGRYTPLSLNAGDCPTHTETVGDRTFTFPPREQPTHASRRSMIAAMQVVEEQNATISSNNAKDWVSIVTFDHLSSGGPVVAQALTSNYVDAMNMCADFQAVGDTQYSTATESGLIAGRNHLTASGRVNTSKVVVLLTDGVPNLKSSSDSDINDYIDDNAHDDWFGSASTTKNAPMMQASLIEAAGWHMYPVGLGLGTDYDFMDRMARMGETANDDGEAFRGSGNPTEYEEVLTDIFETIIKNPKTRLVR